MILRKVSVYGFRSIRKAQDFHVDEFVTVLIGANDHGKTNLLDAIAALNDDYTISAADRNWDTDDEDSPRIRWTFDVRPSERDNLIALAESARAQQQAAADAALEVPDDEASDDVDQEEEEPEPASSPSRTPPAAAVGKPIPGKAAPAPVDEVEEDEEDRPDDEEDATPPVTEQTLDALRRLGTFAFERKGVKSDINIHLPNELETYPFIVKFLLRSRPRVELFKGTTKITDSITLPELDKPENEFMQGIFRKANIWDERSKLFTITPRTQRTLAEASRVLTQRINEEWQQGRNLNFHLSHAGNNGDRINLSIQDPSVEKQYVLPTQRSSGFSAFFGMSMALFARKEASPANNYIFIFDEPGTALHPHGQVNVQRVFETLSKKNQITFTTHSIFMVNKNYPVRNRAVTKTEKGTLIDHKPYIGNWKAVRSNLGLIFTNNFFVADTTLLVEGPADEVYIASLLRTCDRLAAIDVDLNLFSIVDSGNAADMVAMAKLMTDEGRRVVVLVDGDTSGTNTKKRLQTLNKGLPKEATKVEVIQLGEGTSIENFVVYPELLKEAILQAAKELVDDGIRKFKARMDVESIKRTLGDDLKRGNLTLGRAIHEVSKGWFEGDEEPISKLHVARIYDQLVEALDDEHIKPAKEDFDRARGLATDLNKKLGLPEKTARETVTD